MTITARSLATLIAVASSLLVTWWSAAYIAKPQMAPALFQVGAAVVNARAVVSGGQGKVIAATWACPTGSVANGPDVTCAATDKARVSEVTIVDGAGNVATAAVVISPALL